MVDKTSQMFITGPDVVRSVTGEQVTLEELGGARTHNTRSGNAHYLGRDEQDAIDYVRDLLSYLPSNNLSSPPATEWDEDLEVTDADLALDTLIPDAPNQPYDMTTVIQAVMDDGDFLPVQELYAPNVIVGFGRVAGRSVGVVANQPIHLAGTLDINAAEKAARFVRTCDAFNIPVLTFVDVPGFLPGTDQEWNGIIRRGAKLIYAYAEATVPLITVITRKAYGGAYDVMGSKHLGADLNLAWPTAQIAVMGAAGAVNVLYRKEIARDRGRVRGRGAAGRRRAHAAADRLRGHPGQPVHRGRAGLCGRDHQAVHHPHRDHQRAAGAGRQAADAAAAQTREHSTVSAANADDTVSAANADNTVSAANADNTVSAANADDTVSADADAGAEAETESQGKSRTSEEDAAVVIAILTALTAGASGSSSRSGPPSVWADPAHMLRTRLSPGASSWWASGLPR